MCSVNPSAWRGNGSHKKIGDLIQENNLLFVGIHNINDGLKTFKAATRYDWYVVQKNKNYSKTKIIGEYTKECLVDITKFDFIPNFDIDFIYNLLAKNNEDRVDMIYSRSAYGADKKTYKKINQRK